MKRYKKGESGNPSGRPKGAINKTSEQFIEIKKLAAQDYFKAYAVLMEKVEQGEPWAHQLFFKEFIPKKYKQPTISIETLDDTVEGQIHALRKGLAQVSEYTEEGLLDTLKTLSNIKISETVATQEVGARLTREEILEKVNAMQKVIDYAEGNKHEN